MQSTVKRWIAPIVLGVVALVVLGANSATASTAETQTKKMPHMKRWPASSPQRQWLLAFAAEVAPVIRDRGFPLSVALAQACAESGYGKRMPTNPWGVRGIGDMGSSSITTHEDYGKGQVKLSGQKFAKYSSNVAAATAYCDVLSDIRYRPGWPLIGANDGLWLVWLWATGYATARHYPSFVHQVSRRVAVELGDAELLVGWNGEISAIAGKLGATPPKGGKRKELAEKLLKPYMAQPLA